LMPSRLTPDYVNRSKSDSIAIRTTSSSMFDVDRQQNSSRLFPINVNIENQNIDKNEKISLSNDSENRLTNTNITTTNAGGHNHGALLLEPTVHHEITDNTNREEDNNNNNDGHMNTNSNIGPTTDTSGNNERQENVLWYPGFVHSLCNKGNTVVSSSQLNQKNDQNC